MDSPLRSAGILTLVLALAACKQLSLDPASSAHGGRGAVDAPRDFEDDWANWAIRAWPGPDWYANRSQDWRLRAGRLECLTSDDRTAGRTVHLLTREFPATGSGGLTFRASIAPVEPGPLRYGAVAGFLVGAGGTGVDPRATALVQQEPGPDGGLLAVIEADGHLALLDFEQFDERGANWTLPGHANFSGLPELARSAEVLPAELWPLELEFSWTPAPSTAEGGRAELVARGEDGVVLARASASMSRARVAGGVALFSARGPEHSGEGFAFEHVKLTGAADRPKRAWGPVLGVLQLAATDAAGQRSLRMVAQLPVIGQGQVRGARLLLQDSEGTWQEPIESYLTEDGSWTVPFLVEDWQERGRVPYRIEVDLGRSDGYLNIYSYSGSVAPEPAPDEPVVIAALSCLKNQVGPIAWNADGLWFPHLRLEAAVRAHDPDLIVFLGDQIYESDLTPPDRRSSGSLMADYHTKWQRFLWSFGELMRDRPVICLPDDDDVFQGNLWGAGGIRATERGGATAQDAGGYVESPEFVRAVYATQTAHLPPSLLEPRIGRGISTWSTTFAWGGIDFAVVSDRMWKAAPALAQPEGRYVNGWPQAPGFDPQTAPPAKTNLLGRQQEDMLRAWAATRTPGTWTRVLLSQSPFAALTTLPANAASDAVLPELAIPAPGEYPPDDLPVADADTNGWPQGGRQRAVELLRDAGALHLAGDQHLASAAWYGLRDFRDGTVVFSVPAIAGAWPRRWMPTIPGRSADAGPTGDFLDGFGNRVSVLAVGNPVADGREPVRLHERAPGYAIVRFDPQAETVVLEAWRRPASSDAAPQSFPGWPVVLGADGRPK